MYIVPLIEEIVKRYFAMLFDEIESFYLKNFLILVQGILSKRHTSISEIAADESNKVSHTTLTRFVSSHDSFWTTLKTIMHSALRCKINGNPEESSRYSRILIMDDTLIKRRGKKIPFAFKQYDHCENRFVHGQVILTIGQMIGNLFQPLDMIFARSSKDPSESYDSKIDMAVSWLKKNDVQGSLVIADSWYTNSTLIESCKSWFESDFIGQIKGNIILQVEGEVLKADKLRSTSKLPRSLIVNGKTIRYQSYQANVQSLRMPVKLVVTELDDHTRAVLICSDTELSSEMIIQYYALRWSIETFFKFAKQNLSLARCQIRSEDGQTHFLILIIIICQIFNDLKEILRERQKNISIRETFLKICAAVSHLPVMLVRNILEELLSLCSPESHFYRCLQLILDSLLLPRTL